MNEDEKTEPVYVPPVEEAARIQKALAPLGYEVVKFGVEEFQCSEITLTLSAMQSGFFRMA